MSGFDARALLKTRTARAHHDLDSALAGHDLATRGGLVAALSIHALGMDGVWSCASDFAARCLGGPLPDYPAMLSADLAWLNAGVVGSPAPALDPRYGAGACYVVLGSRLGTAVLRKQGVWRDAQGRASAYMEDTEGLARWRDMVAWLVDVDGAAVDQNSLEQGALAAFDHFYRAACLHTRGPAARQDIWDIQPA